MFAGFLDFPPVNVSVVEEHVVQIHFVHPWYFYSDRLLSQSANNNVPKFEYSVELVSQVRTQPRLPSSRRSPRPNGRVSVNRRGFLFLQNTTHRKTCKSHLCSAKFQVHSAQETHCAKVNGEMKDMLVKGKHVYCMQPLMEPPNKTS